MERRSVCVKQKREVVPTGQQADGYRAARANRPRARQQACSAVPVVDVPFRASPRAGGAFGRLSVARAGGAGRTGPGLAPGPRDDFGGFQIRRNRDLAA